MQESIIPWDGVNGDASFLKLIDQSGTGLVLIKGSFSAQPYSCMLDSRNDTWFSLDRVVVCKQSNDVLSMCSDGNTNMTSMNPVNRGSRAPILLSERVPSSAESRQESMDLDKSDGSDSREAVDVKGVVQKYVTGVLFIPQNYEGSATRTGLVGIAGQAEPDY